MKNIYSAIAILVIATLSYSAIAQEILQGSEARKIISNAEMIRTSQYGQQPSFIRYSRGQEPNFSLYISNLEKNLKVEGNLSLSLISENADELGFVHYRYKQLYNGKPLESTMWIIHTRAGKIVSQNGFIHRSMNLNSKVSLNTKQAINSAKRYVDASIYRWEIQSEEDFIKIEQGDDNATFQPVPVLSYVTGGTDYSADQYLLAYKMNIYAMEPLSHQTVYVNANTGEIIKTNQLIHHTDAVGTATTGYSGVRTITSDLVSANNYRLREAGRGNGIETFNLQNGTSYGSAVDFVDSDNNWNNANANLDQYAGDAHWGAEMTYDYLLNNHNWNSIDNLGFKLISYVHFDNSYNNAFWDGSRMTYGDGNNAPLTSIDIAGHEITHGLTSNTANLDYQGESGALNESFSDIFGTSVERFGRPNNWNWEIGEDLGSAFRSLSDPNSMGDPDTYFGANWASLSGGDQGGVHTNSSVQNYWFYLLSDGGTGTNDNGDVYNVTGIGVDDAASVAFRNLTVYLINTHKFIDARFFAIQSAIDLFGACTPKVGSVTDAWYAVGVGTNYVPNVVADFNVESATSCTAPFDVEFQDNSSNALTYSWDFGDGTTSTLRNPNHTYANSGAYTVELSTDGGSCGTDITTKTDYIQISDTLPCTLKLPTFGTATTQTGCSGKLFDSGGKNGNYGGSENATITIAPTGATSVVLHFISFDIEPGTGSTCDYDKLTIYDGMSSSAPIIGVFCNNNIPTSVTSTGNSITIVFSSDGGVEGAGFELDWICNSPNTPPISNFSVALNSCSGEVSFLDGSNNTPTSWAWNFGDGQTSTMQNPTHTYLKSGNYDVTLTASNAFGGNSHSELNAVNMTFASTPTALVNPICQWQTDTIIATSPGQSYWYNNINDTVPVFAGDTFITPVLSATQTYYLQQQSASNNTFVGPIDNSFGGGAIYSGDQSQIFDVYSDLTILSVEAYADGSGTRTIELKDENGSLLETLSINLIDGFNIIPLNFQVPVGTGYWLGTATGSQPALFRNNTGTNYPYTNANVMSITSSTAGNGFYYFFYNWKVQSNSCLSERIEVVAVVDVCTSVNDLEGTFKVDIYPNPASNVVTIEWNDLKSNLETSIVIINSLGQEIRHLNVNSFQTTLNVSTWAKGVYFVTIQQNEQQFIKKLVIE